MGNGMANPSGASADDIVEKPNLNVTPQTIAEQQALQRLQQQKEQQEREQREREREQRERKQREQREREQREQEERARQREQQKPKQYTEEQKARLKERIRKNLRKGLLGASKPGESEDESVESWLNVLLNPRAVFDNIMDNWFVNKDNTRDGDVRGFRIAFTLNGNPGTMDKYVARFLKGTKFNALHAAVRVYDQVVDWRNNSLTYPREAALTDPLIMLSIGEIKVERLQTPTVTGLRYHSPAIDALCEGIIEWNLTKEYSVHTCNCAHFFDDIIDRIQKVDSGVKFSEPDSADKSLEKYLNNVRRGNLDRTITEDMVNFELLDLNNKKTKSITFTSHRELDQWVHKLHEKFHGPDLFKLNYPNLRELLKSFDRAFQKDFNKFTLQYTALNSRIMELEGLLNSRSAPLPPEEKAKLQKELAQQKEMLKKTGDLKVNCMQAECCAFPPEPVSCAPSLPSKGRSGISGVSGTSKAGGSTSQ